MIPYQINDKETALAPSCWPEVKTGIYQRLVREVKKDDNPVKLFAILTGTEYQEVWDNAREDLDAAIYQAVAFIANDPQDFKKAPRPQTFRLAGATVMVPEHIQKLTVGQNFELRDMLTEADKNKHSIETLLSRAVAVYLQPLVDGGPFNPKRIPELNAEIEQMPIADVWPLGFFLLHRLITYGHFGTASWFSQKLRSLRSKLPWPRKQASTSSSRSSASARSTNTPPAMASSPASSSRSPSTNSSPSSSYGQDREPTSSDSKQ